MIVTHRQKDRWAVDRGNNRRNYRGQNWRLKRWNDRRQNERGLIVRWHWIKSAADVGDEHPIQRVRNPLRGKAEAGRAANPDLLGIDGRG